MAQCVVCQGEVPVVDANGRCPACAAVNPLNQPTPTETPVTPPTTGETLPGETPSQGGETPAESPAPSVPETPSGDSDSEGGGPNVPPVA